MHVISLRDHIRRPRQAMIYAIFSAFETKNLPSGMIYKQRRCARTDQCIRFTKNESQWNPGISGTCSHSYPCNKTPSRETISTSFCPRYKSAQLDAAHSMHRNFLRTFFFFFFRCSLSKDMLPSCSELLSGVYRSARSERCDGTSIA